MASERRRRGVLGAVVGLVRGSDDRAKDVFRFRCPSVVEELRFLVAVETRWRVPEEHALIRSRIHRQLHESALDVCRNYSVLDAEEARSQLTLAISSATWVVESPLGIVVVDCVLSADTDTLVVAAQLENVAHQSVVEVARNKSEIERMLLLRDTVLVDIAMIRLWWLNGDRERLKDIEGLQSTFENTAKAFGVDAAAGGGLSDARAVARLIEEFLAGLGPQHRALLVTQLAAVFRSYEQPTLADKVDRLLGG